MGNFDDMDDKIRKAGGSIKEKEPVTEASCAALNARNLAEAKRNQQDMIAEGKRQIANENAETERRKQAAKRLSLQFPPNSKDT